MFKQSASITVAGLTLGGLLMAGSPAGAQIVNAPYIEQRQDYQEQRIQRGVDSGTLTPGETRYLDREQGRIQNTEDRMQADGNLSTRERGRLNRMENRSSRDIYRLNHNDRTAGGHGGNWSGHSNTYDPRIERREAYQERTIRQGIRSGELTPGEARYLNREQAHIDRAEDRMSADGRLSLRERQRLNQMQNQASRDIYRLENNHRTAGGYGDHRPGWQGHNRDWDGRNHGWQANRGWDRRDDRWHGDHRGWDRRDAAWRGHNSNHAPGRNDYNHGWQANGNSGWHGNNPVGNGYPSRAGYTPGQGNGNSGWHGTNPAGNGYPSRGTTPGGPPTAGYTGQGNGSGWRGNGPGNTGHTPGGTTTASNPQGWQGNSAYHGQPGRYQQAGAPTGVRPGQPAGWQGQRPSAPAAQPQMRPSQPAPWQGRQQLQQARAPMPQPTMRPNTNMMARQPMMGGMVNRAGFSAPRGAAAPSMRRR